MQETHKGQTPAVPGARVTLNDLLQHESEALRRIARDIEEGLRPLSGHQSYTSGHRSSGQHSSHSSSQVERPLD